MPAQAALTGQVILESISHDGRTVSFSQPGNTPPARTGVIDLQTGAVTFMCAIGCWRLVVN